MTFVSRMDVVLVLNQSPCIKKKKEVYSINLENDETNYEPNIIHLLYRILY